MSRSGYTDDIDRICEATIACWQASRAAKAARRERARVFADCESAGVLRWCDPQHGRRVVAPREAIYAQNEYRRLSVVARNKSIALSKLIKRALDTQKDTADASAQAIRRSEHSTEGSDCSPVKEPANC